MAKFFEKKEKAKETPKPESPKSGGASASSSPAYLWSGNLCDCGKPVAPGQNQVCIEHQKSH